MAYEPMSVEAAAVPVKLNLVPTATVPSTEMRATTRGARSHRVIHGVVPRLPK